MKRFKRIPRIIRILKIKGLRIHCAFNNGEYRIIDFEQLHKLWKVKVGDFDYPLTQPTDLKKVELINGTLSWPHIAKTIKLSTGQSFETHLDYDPIVLYENSTLDEKANKRYQIGNILRNARLAAGLTQEELAIRSGTTKNYISRIENNRSDIELRTLRKIIEIGLDRKLEIAVS